MGKSQVASIWIGFHADPDDLGGGNRANLVCAEAIRRNFLVVDNLHDAELQVQSFSWKAPLTPPRLFIDHGSFADASFWAYTAPGLQRSDTILVSSKVCVRVAERCFEGQGPLLQCVPFSVDLDLFRPVDDRPAIRRQLRDEHGVPVEGPLLLVVSAFVRRKNHHLAVRFLEALSNEMPKARLVIVGGRADRPRASAYRDAFADLAEATGVASRVHFMETVPQSRLSRLMAGADLLLHFTNCRLENFGLVVAEAMAAGLPVVAADWGGLRDLVLPAETGFLARTYLTVHGPRTDWLSVVGPAARILRDRSAWNVMSRRARRRAEEHLSLETYRARLQTAIEAALEHSLNDSGPVALGLQATELRFRTIGLNATHPEIESTGDEFRLLMSLDGGVHYRFLAGPAATDEHAPVVRSTDRLYSVVTWSAEGGGVRITDPAWPGLIKAEPRQIELARRCDGTMTLDDLFESMRIRPEERPAALGLAQALVDLGVLCPVA